MKTVYVTDVKDGLCMGLSTLFNQVIQIDCGCQYDPKAAFDGLKRLFQHFRQIDYFVLSHFHADHYNGLLYSTNLSPSFRPYSLKKVFFPRIPKFSESRQFELCLYVMNERLFGSETGSREADFLNTVKKLNVSNFSYRPLSKGDAVMINGSRFEVLWPPRTFRDNDKTLAPVRRAIRLFDDAKETDREIQRLYEQLYAQTLWPNEEGVVEKSESPERNGQSTLQRRDIPETVKKANEALNDAANHLSLVLCEGNRFIFWGDAERSEIKEIATELISNERSTFYIAVTPHHGTHWHKILTEMSFVFAVSSNGPKLVAHTKPFKEISQRALSTFINGEMELTT